MKLLPADRGERGERVTALLLASYVALWIVEGAFRKWVPGMSMVFYVLRDGYAVLALIWFAATRTKPGRRLPWWVATVPLALGIWLGIQVAQPSAPAPMVLLFGLRSYIAPLLFALLTYKYGTASTLRTCIAVVLGAVPVELGLTVLQVLQPATSFLNQEVGGTANMFVNGGEVVRATGTYAAPLGLTVYLLVALVVTLWTTTQQRGRLLGWGLTAAVLGTVALSGARGAVLNSAIAIAAYLVCTLARPTASSVGRVVLLIALLGAALVAVQVAFPEVLSSFTTRFVDANASEDSSARLFDGFLGYLGIDPTWLGDGFGSHSNAGLALGSSAGWIENDSLRWVAELGMLGWTLSFLRTLATLALVAQFVLRLRADGMLLGLLRAALIALLALGSVNETPMSEGGFGVLLGMFVLGMVLRSSPPAAPAIVHAREPEAVAAA